MLRMERGGCTLRYRLHPALAVPFLLWGTDALAGGQPDVAIVDETRSLTLPMPDVKPAAPRPSYLLLRQDEDWSALADPRLRTDPLDFLKFIPLNRSGSSFLSVAADAFVAYRAFDNELHGLVPGYHGSANTRANVHVGLTLGSRVRLYGALKHGDVYGGDGVPLPVNRNRLDLHQAFLELGFGDVFGLAPRDVFVRVGRQEIQYGSGGLIAARLGPNVRSNYDGLLARARFGRVVSDAFLFRGVEDRPGFFDDRPDRTNTLWGSYTTITGERLSKDVFYIAQHATRSSYAAEPRPFDEMRHTIGARLWSAKPSAHGLTMGLQAELQFGHARNAAGQQLRIRAWNIEGLLVRTTKLPLRPTFGLELGINSGDTDPNDSTLGTYRAPSPPGRFFGDANAFGPGNLAGARFYIELHPTPKLRLRPKVRMFWRVETSDGTYTLGPSVLRGGNGTAHYLGVETAVELGYTINPHLEVSGSIAKFVGSSYFAVNPPDSDVSYVKLTVAFKL